MSVDAFSLVHSQGFICFKIKTACGGEKNRVEKLNARNLLENEKERLGDLKERGNQ